MEGTPVILKGFASLLSADGSWDGQTAGLKDPSRIRAPNNTPMWVDEIRFLGSNFDGKTMGGVLHVQMRLGGFSLTKGFVPIWCLGKLLNPLEQRGSFQGYTWRLPKPLLVPPGKPLEITFAAVNPAVTRYDAGNNSTMDLHIGVVGRLLPAMYWVPQKIDIPWVAHWQSAVKTTGGAGDVYVQSSTPTDLVNPFEEPVFVHGFLGRMIFRFSADFAEVGGSDGDGGEISSNFTTVRMASSYGTIIVRDPTPFSHLFSNTDRQWRVSAVLPPKGFYTVTLAQNYATVTAGSDAYAQISVVGHRQVTL
jgi:hypothetical protein